MRPDLGLQLQASTYQNFSMAVSNEIDSFLHEQSISGEAMSFNDQKAIYAIKFYLEQNNTSGEILRQDLEIILGKTYNFLERIFRSFPRRIMALRDKEQFSSIALRRGDAQMRHPNSQILQLQEQLQIESSEKKSILHAQKQLTNELKESINEQLLLLEKNAALQKELLLAKEAGESQKQNLITLEQQCAELRKILLTSGIALPSHLSWDTRNKLEQDAQSKPWSWSNSQSASPVLFSKDSKENEIRQQPVQQKIQVNYESVIALA